MTLLAVVAGPVGVVLGFGLSVWGEHVKAQREASDRRHEQAVSRALGLLAAASTVEGDGRGLAYAAYLERIGRRVGVEQVRTVADSLNSAMATLDRFILEADVLGPDGLGDIGRTLQARARDLLGIVDDMNKRFTGTSAQKVQDETLPALVAAIEAATVQVRDLLKASRMRRGVQQMIG